MAKQDSIRENYDRVVQELFTDKNVFAEYLRFSGRFYKLPSAQTIVLYDDNPKAEMVADFDTWKRFGRTVKPNGWSTDVLENGKVKRLFDISMTRGEKEPRQWTLNRQTAEKFIDEISDNTQKRFSGMSDCIDYLTSAKIDETLDTIGVSEVDAEKFKHSFSSMVCCVVAARCEWKSDFKYSSELDLSALDMITDTEKKETMLEQIQIAAKSILLSMEKSINNIVYERSIENERNKRAERAVGAGIGGTERTDTSSVVRGGEGVLSDGEDATRETVSVERKNIRVRSDDEFGAVERGEGTDERTDPSLGSSVEKVYGAELSGVYTDASGQDALGSDTAQDRSRSTGAVGDSTRGIPEDEPAPYIGERDSLGGTAATDDARTDLRAAGERSENIAITSKNNNETSEERSSDVFDLAVKIADLSNKLGEKYRGAYNHLTMANYALSHQGDEYDANISVRDNAEKFLSTENAAFIREYLNDVFAEAFEDHIIVAEGETASQLLEELEKLQKGEHIQTELENGEEVLSGELNKFYVDSDNDTICLVYYNPASSANGSLVYNYFTFGQLEEALSSERPFDYILEVCKSEWLDRDTSVFEESMREFLKNGEDFSSIGNVLPSGLSELVEKRKEAVRQRGEKQEEQTAAGIVAAVPTEKEISEDALSARLVELTNEISEKQAAATELFSKQEFSEAAELTREVSELARLASELKAEIQTREIRAEDVDALRKAQEKFFIYQMKADEQYHGIRFESFEANKGNDLTANDYDLVFTGDWESVQGNSSEEKLESIYNAFNEQLPEDFTGHPLSISDVIAVGYSDIPDSLTAHYVDKVGFAEIPEFFKERSKELNVTNKLNFSFGGENKDWFTESDLLANFANENPNMSFALGNAILKYLDEKQNSERIVNGLEVGWYDKTDFEIRAVIDGEEYGYSGRYDIGDGDGTLVEHIAAFSQHVISSNSGLYNEENKQSARDTLDKLVPFLERNSVLTAEEQKILDDFKLNNPIRTFADVRNVEPKPMIAEQVGDFYEFYGEDARLLSNALNLHLTTKNNQDMTGFPAQMFIENAEKLAKYGYTLLDGAKIAEERLKESTEKIKAAHEREEKRVEKSVENVEKHDFVISDDHLGEGGQKAKYAANIAAIKLLKAIESENRLATPAEQETLSQYVGWGGIPQAFDSESATWSNEYTQLKQLLTPDEYEAARSTVLTAHFTSPIIISAIYSALENFGFNGGNVLEPSMGIGNFFGVMPPKIRENSKLSGVELDDISGRIAKQLYQNADIQVCGYENTSFSDNYFDVAIGNVPFGNYAVADKRYDKERFLIHDYFFAKTLDKVAPGGVVAFITSKGTLDKTNPKVREYLAKRADLIGAIRLPNNAFKGNAGTEVTADIIFLQKRNKMSVEMPDWCYTAQIADGISVNQYFIDHPEMMLGEMRLVSGRYGEETACVPIDGAELKEQLHGAVSRLKRDIIVTQREQKRSEEHGIIPATADVRNFTFADVNGKIYFRENNIMREIPFSKRNHDRMRGIIGIRNTFREMVNAQCDGCSDKTLTDLQFRLNAEYDAFVNKFGYISNIENKKVFEADDDYNALCGALELIDPETKTVKKADVFTKRTIKPYSEITHVDTPQEALIASMDIRGAVDIDYMSELCGNSGEEVIKELSDDGLIYKNPDTDKYEETAEYLSGNVREKLRAAQKAAEKFPEYERNIAALEKVQPAKLGAGDISVRLGCPWVSVEDYCNFFNEYTQGMLQAQQGHSYSRQTILYRSIAGEYKIENKGADKSLASQSTYGTKRMNSYAIFENLLNNRDIAVYDNFELPDGKKKRVMNKNETQLAQEKARLMKDAFPKWLWSEPKRREKYVEIYNELFNSLVGREYDGSHQTFPGMSPLIELTEHQKNAVMRAKVGGNTLLAHCVGAGKTFEMAAAVMEKLRIGLINKACVVVPKHLVGQMAAEWQRLYPEARLLTAKENDFNAVNRQKFIGRCCTGNYDAVIMSYQQFQIIPMSLEFQQDFLVQQIDELSEQLQDYKGRYLFADDKRSVKDIERTKKLLEAKLKRLLDTPHDNSLSFEQLGFDSLVIDEAHNYKNGLVVTKMKNVSGIGSKAAQKSEDFLMKTKYLNEKFGEKNLILATGTPVSNSMTELYIMQQYLRPSALLHQGLQNFDDWANTFGEVVSQLELKPAGDGFRMKKRFAKFTNLPELMQTYKDFADIRTADMLNLPTPDIEGGKPQIISAKPNEFQQAYMTILAARSEAIHNGNVDPSEDNMLKITNEARLLGLDARCISPDAGNDPYSKVNLLISKVMEIYTETTPQKGVQAIFCDIAINGGGNKVAEDTDEEIDEAFDDDSEKILSVEKQTELLGASKFSVYDYIKEELISRGIPANEICFAGDAKNQGQRSELYAQLRAGTKRIVIASTSKMGTGANVQTRLCALHNLDIPWKPSDFEQRIGRIVRQGNTFSTVKIFNYVTEGTFDAYMLNLIVTKQKFISQLMSGKAPARTCEDIDDAVLNYSEMQAIASGDPRIKEKIQLDTDVSRLRLLESEHMNNKYRLEDKATLCKAQLSISRKQLDLAFKDKEFAAKNQLRDGDFEMEINGRIFTERKDAGAELRKAQMTFLSTKKPEEIGEYRGFRLSLNWELVGDEQHNVSALLRKPDTGLTYSAGLELLNDIGNITRIENVLKFGIEKRIAALESEIYRNEKDLAEAERTKDAPFEYAEELAQKSLRLAQLDAELGIEKSDEIVFDDNEKTEDEHGKGNDKLEQNQKPKRPKH